MSDHLLIGEQKGEADTSNFDEEFTKEQPTLTPVHGQLSTRDQAEFNGFSWVRLCVMLCFGTILIKAYRLPRGQTYDRYQVEEPLPEIKMYDLSFVLPYSTACAMIIMLYNDPTIYAHVLYLLQFLPLFTLSSGRAHPLTNY